MTIQELKKELGLSNKEIALFFNMSYAAYANSSAKKRYENAICDFYYLFKLKMLDMKKLIGNYTHKIVDESKNKWEVVEVSDLHDIFYNLIQKFSIYVNKNELSEADDQITDFSVTKFLKMEGYL